MENLKLPKPAWWDDGQDEATIVPTPGGLFDGLPSADIGSSLHLLMDPKDIATIDETPATVREGVTWDKPVAALPAGPDPEEYARRGEMAGRVFLSPTTPDGNTESAGPFYMAQDLLKFRKGASLDAQAYGASPAYGNYTFGVYNAAAGISLPEALDMANTYGKFRSEYHRPDIDPKYTSIPGENVQNITSGYNDYKNGTLRRRP